MNPITRKPRAYGPLHLAVSIFPDSDGTSRFLSVFLFLSFFFPRAARSGPWIEYSAPVLPFSLPGHTDGRSLRNRAYVSRPFVSRCFSVSPSIPLPLLFIPAATADAVAAAAATTDDDDDDDDSAAL